MGRQLHLLTANDDAERAPGAWRLDAKTVAVGRKGLVKARAALKASRAGGPTTEPSGARPASRPTTRRRRKAA